MIGMGYFQLYFFQSHQPKGLGWSTIFLVKSTETEGYSYPGMKIVSCRTT